MLRSIVKEWVLAQVHEDCFWEPVGLGLIESFEEEV